MNRDDRRPPEAVLGPEIIRHLLAGADEMTTARWFGIEERALLDIVVATLDANGATSLSAAAGSLGSLAATESPGR